MTKNSTAAAADSSSCRRGRHQAVAKGRCSPAGVCSISSLLLLGLLLAVPQQDQSSSSSLSSFAKGEPSQQQRGGQSNELGQDFSSGSGLADGLATLNGYGRGAYTNAKRARGKMSAFMPMRGRKDGRDLVGVDSLRGVSLSPASAFYQQQQQRQALDIPSGDGQPPFVREMDPNDDASLARLISGGASSPASGGGGGGVVGNYQRYYSSVRDNAIPRQFYNQFQSASAQQQLGDDARRELAAASQSHSGGGAQRLASVSLEQAAEPLASNQIMQAKLRRAFHPMRGKKSLFDQWGQMFEGLDAQS